MRFLQSLIVSTLLIHYSLDTWRELPTIIPIHINDVNSASTDFCEKAGPDVTFQLKSYITPAFQCVSDDGSHISPKVVVRSVSKTIMTPGYVTEEAKKGDW